MIILILGGTGSMGTGLGNIAAGNDNDIYVTTRRDRQLILNNVHREGYADKIAILNVSLSHIPALKNKAR